MQRIYMYDPAYACSRIAEEGTDALASLYSESSMDSRTINTHKSHDAAEVSRAE